MVVGDVITEIGKIGLWLKTAGIIFILWIIFQVVNFIINRKRMKEIYNIKGDMRRIEKKIDGILKKK
jgi:hypothetical protein